MNHPSRKSCFELRAALSDLFLRQSHLARMCGVDKVTVWKWCEGKLETPPYVWALLSAMKGVPKWELVQGKYSTWEVKAHHVYRNGRTFKALARRFHPDTSGRDTKAEMQQINGLRGG